MRPSGGAERVAVRQHLEPMLSLTHHQRGRGHGADIARTIPATANHRPARVLCWGAGLLFMASLLPVWTGLGGKCFYNPGTGPYKPPFEMRNGRIVTKTTFWQSDAFHDLVAWFDIVNHFD